MNPADRQLWLARHNAPKNMRLITDLELKVIENGLKGTQAARAALQTIVEASADALQHYWTNEPDMQNACAAAVFDAARFHAAIDQAQGALKCAQETFGLIAEHGLNTTTLMDLATSNARVTGALVVISQQLALTRQRIPPCPPPSTPTANTPPTGQP